MRRDQVSPRASPQPISLAAGAPSSSSSRCPSRCVSDVAFNVCREGSRFPFPKRPAQMRTGSPSRRRPFWRPVPIYPAENVTGAREGAKPLRSTVLTHPPTLRSSTPSLRGSWRHSAGPTGPKRREEILPTCRALQAGGAKRGRSAIVAHGGRNDAGGRSTEVLMREGCRPPCYRARESWCWGRPPVSGANKGRPAAEPLQSLRARSRLRCWKSQHRRTPPRSRRPSLLR